MSKTMTIVTMYVYHDGIDDGEILEAARFFTDTLEDALHDDTGIEIDIPHKYVAVHTAPFKVE